MPAYIGDGRGQPGIEGRQAAVETGDLTPQEPADGEQNADREDSPIRETSLSPRPRTAASVRSRRSASSRKARRPPCSVVEHRGHACVEALSPRVFSGSVGGEGESTLAAVIRPAAICPLAAGRSAGTALARIVAVETAAANTVPFLKTCGSPPAMRACRRPAVICGVPQPLMPWSETALKSRAGCDIVKPMMSVATFATPRAMTTQNLRACIRVPGEVVDDVAAQFFHLRVGLHGAVSDGRRDAILGGLQLGLQLDLQFISGGLQPIPQQLFLLCLVR